MVLRGCFSRGVWERATSVMKTINVKEISANPGKRLQFLEDFIGFTQDDWKALSDSVDILGPKLPQMLDALYEHLLSFDDTRRIFLGKRGEVDPEYIAIRKEHLTAWLLKTVGGGDRSAFAAWLVSVGKAHTGVAGENDRVVPPRYMVGLVAFIQTSFLSTLFEQLPNEPEKVQRMGLAWNKMMMMQLEIFLKQMAPAWPQWDET